MSVGTRLRVALLCGILQLGTMVGVPMRPEEIQELLHRLNQPKVASVLPGHTASGDRPPDDSSP